ncbi:EamA family transporter RarD [soil metagenome]
MTSRRTSGLLYGLGAYGCWGVFPGFFPLLQPAGALEVLAHRILWTVVLMAVIVIAVRRVGDLAKITGRVWLLLAVAAFLISVNWLIYIYAVNNGHVVDAALGYFITPLVSVAVGVLLFRETLNKAQMAALLIALVAVAVLAVQLGSVPWVALGLAVSFGLYGAVKKLVPTDPRVSVGVEAGLAAPLALVYVVVIEVSGTGEFFSNGPGHSTLMVVTGLVTAIPLLCFAAAAQRLPLVTLGLLMYVNPVLQMTWGLVVGQEPMPPARWVGFALIWVALAVFSVDAVVRASSSATKNGSDVDAVPDRSSPQRHR